MRTTTLLATTENIPVAIGFVTDELDSFNCPMNARMKIELAVDEIFCNIASYAYAPGVGEVVIEVDYDKKARTVHIVFKDRGVRYDPLAKDDPDVTLSASERTIGGLGIFLVKKSMDDMYYEYRDGMNILHLIKKI